MYLDVLSYIKSICRKSNSNISLTGNIIYLLYSYLSKLHRIILFVGLVTLKDAKGLFSRVSERALYLLKLVYLQSFCYKYKAKQLLHTHENV